LPPEDKEKMVKKFNKIKEKSIDERMKFMKQTMFWKSLSEQERTIFKKLMFPN
jgi:hypothetical protein